MRVFSRMRWWCTAEVSSSDGIGAMCSVESRSLSTMRRAPAAMAVDTSRRTRSSASRSASPPPLTGYSPCTVTLEKPGRSPSSLTCTILDRSSFDSTGKGSTICRQDAGDGVSRFCSGPIEPDSEVTSSSRMASSGGLVTWAKSWLK